MEPVSLENVTRNLSAHFPFYSWHRPVYQHLMLETLQRFWERRRVSSHEKFVARPMDWLGGRECRSNQCPSRGDIFASARHRDDQLCDDRAFDAESHLALVLSAQ
jgi:hypothetical protein